MTEFTTALLQPGEKLPEYPAFDPAYRRAPRRESELSESDRELAIIDRKSVV